MTKKGLPLTSGTLSGKRNSACRCGSELVQQSQQKRDVGSIVQIRFCAYRVV
jgi:hypothetical protein